jgi:hypothetical protein
VARRPVHAGKTVAPREEPGDIRTDERSAQWLNLVGKGGKPGKVALPPLARMFARVVQRMHGRSDVRKEHAEFLTRVQQQQRGFVRF